MSTDRYPTSMARLRDEGIGFRVNIESYGMSPGIVRTIQAEIQSSAAAAGIRVAVENIDGYFLRVTKAV